MESIGQRVKRLRLASGYSQSGLADAAHCTQQTIGYLERDRRATNFYTFIELARVFGVSLDYIAYGERNGTDPHHNG